MILWCFKEASMLLNTGVELPGYIEHAFISFVAVVTNLTSRGHSFSISHACRKRYISNLKFLNKHNQRIRSNPFQVWQTIINMTPATKLYWFHCEGGHYEIHLWSTVWQLEWPSQTCVSVVFVLLTPPLMGNGKGQSFSLSARTWDYVGERRQKGLGEEMARRLDFCLTEQSHLMYPEDCFQPSWLTFLLL